MTSSLASISSRRLRSSAVGNGAMAIASGSSLFSNCGIRTHPFLENCAVPPTPCDVSRAPKNSCASAGARSSVRSVRGKAIVSCVPQGDIRVALLGNSFRIPPQGLCAPVLERKSRTLHRNQRTWLGHASDLLSSTWSFKVVECQSLAVNGAEAGTGSTQIPQGGVRSRRGFDFASEFFQALAACA